MGPPGPVQGLLVETCERRLAVEARSAGKRRSDSVSPTSSTKSRDYPFFRQKIVWTRTEAAARTRSDADYAFFSTAPSRRREILWTRTEAAARTRSDADYALFSIDQNGKS